MNSQSEVADAALLYSLLIVIVLAVHSVWLHRKSPKNKIPNLRFYSILFYSDSLFFLFFFLFSVIIFISPCAVSLPPSPSLSTSLSTATGLCVLFLFFFYNPCLIPPGFLFFLFLNLSPSHGFNLDSRPRRNRGCQRLSSSHPRTGRETRQGGRPPHQKAGGRDPARSKGTTGPKSW